MDVEEFIDTYSDDIIYLHEGRAALLTHPLRADWGLRELLDASFCRMLAVFTVGNIEAMLQRWRDRDQVQVLDTYFAQEKGRNGSNRERVLSLFQAFHNAGIPVDLEVFEDYLAIKYLRNAIVHAGWNEREKEWLEQRGFPTDTRKLTKEHLDKIEHVNQNMMFYGFLTTQVAGTMAKPDKLVRLDETITRRVDETGILRYEDLNKIIWNNLERVYAHIHVDVESTAISEQYNWARGRSQAELSQLTMSEAKRLFYLAARRAGEDGHELLVRHRTLAGEAGTFWNEYWDRAVAGRGLQAAEVSAALAVLERPEFGKVAPLWLPIKEMPDAEAQWLIDSTLGDDAPFTSGEVAGAFRTGNLAYQVVPNITPVGLFTLLLPIVDPANTASYLIEAQRILDVFRLGRLWYSWVEYHGDKGLEYDAQMGFYKQMQREFAGR